jgi:predicted P-loop ATPase
MNSPLIKRFGKEKRWVNYRLETKGDKQTKIPYFSKLKKASSTDEKTWRTYDEVSTALDNGSNKFSGLGIVLHDSKLICIDIDHVVMDGKVFHAQAEKILDLLKKANSFTEISQSGTGLHIFIEVDEEFSPVVNKKAPFEIYSNGRYIATTNMPYKNKALPLRTVSKKEILQILETTGYPWGTVEQGRMLGKGVKEENENMQKAVNSLLLDDELLTKMFKSKNGEEIKELYNGTIESYDGDASKADMALLSHLAFWSQKNAEQMDKLWMASPLGSREKTQKRKDYRDRSIRNAIARCKEVYTPFVDSFANDNPGLDLLYMSDSRGNKMFVQNTENMARILRKHDAFAGRFRYDEFKNMMEIQEKGRWRNIIDSDAINIQTKISILFPFFGKVGKDMVYDAMILVCRENIFDSAVDFIKSIIWDKKERLDTWLTKTYQVPDDVYHRAVGSNWVKGMVKRLIEPGCKFDYVLVLEGEQGTKKSTSLSVLGDVNGYNWHVETTMSTDSKDFFMQMQGKSIIEFSEGETLSRTEVKRMKAIITTQTDKYRPAYGRMSEDFARRCVFAMTTNQSEYLKDETGNRRWLPVACIGDANIEWLRENRNQLFAEAYYRLVEGKETVHEFPEEETKKAQSSRRIADPNTENIMNWYINICTPQQKDDGVSIQDVYNGAFLGNFSSNPKGMDRGKEMAIGIVLKDYLKLERRRNTVKGVQAYRYFDDNNQYHTRSEFELKMPTVQDMIEKKTRGNEF